MASETLGSILRFGVFELDLKEGQLRKSGVRLRLRPQALRVLALLADHSGELVTREELRKTIWPDGLVVDFDQGLNFCVRQIRTALSDDADTPRFIETVPRRGYRFLVPVQRELYIKSTPTEEKSTPAEERPSTVHALDSPAGSAGGNRSNSTNHSGRNIALAATAFAGSLALAVLVYFPFERQRSTDELAPLRNGSVAQIRSLAVLPLVNLSADRTQEFFADGMTEALIGRLSAIGELRVVSRTSVMQFKQAQRPVREIAKELNVDAVIEGAVLRSEDRVRITVRLVRAGMDENVWSSVYDRDAGDVLSLQAELAQAIARQIEVRVSGQDDSFVHSARRVSPQVYDSYLRGRFHLNKGGRAAVEESARHFRQAIAGDRAFAPAWSGLATAYTNFGSATNAISPVAESLPKADSAASKALELDPELAEAHGVLGIIRWQQWRRAEAEKEYRRAIELDPNDALSLERLGSLLVYLGRAEEGLALAKRARELDPLPLDRTVRLGWLLFHARQYDEAIRDLRTVLSVDQDRVAALWFLGFVLIEKEQAEEAIGVLERVALLSGRNPAHLGVLARAYARGGRRHEATKILDELFRMRRVRYVPSAVFVHAYIGLGDYDKAFLWLDRACREHSNIVQFLRTHPIYDPLRPDPRFANLLRRTGLA
jgi:TolB-like protein/DNA-binding winged helix-turn-helix (wHTH) protein/Flp pilus assembly protein TadD